MLLFSCDVLDVLLEGLILMGKWTKNGDLRSLHAKLHKRLDIIY